MKFSLRYVFGFILLFLSSLLSSCADPHFLDKTKKDSSVIQGEAVIEDDPVAKKVVFIGHNFDQSSGQSEYFGLCTGVIIHPRIVLTAAHCAENYKTSKVITTLNAKRLQMSDEKVSDENIFSITKAIPHPQYFNTKTVTTNPNYDLALLKLNRPLSVPTTKITLSTLESASFNSDEVLQKTKLFYKNNHGLVLGYGRTTALLDPTQKKEPTQQLNGELNFTFIDLKSSDLNAALFSVPRTILPSWWSSQTAKKPWPWPNPPFACPPGCLNGSHQSSISSPVNCLPAT